jgi:hypothetical protein
MLVAVAVQLIMELLVAAGLAVVAAGKTQMILAQE